MTTTPTVNAASSTPASPSPPHSPGGRLKTVLQGNFRQYGMVAALVVIVILFQVWTSGILLKPLNVTNIVQQNGYILILAIGMVIVIISGHIDLSVGSIAGFIGAMSAVLMIHNHMPWPIAVVVCLAMGAAIGAWQGFWIAYVGIPSFIVTLAGMLVFRGATQYLLEGQSIAPFPRSFQQVSSGFLPEMGGNSLY
ncbi:MAG: putative multiple sugar transport system permease protein, partial [Mycobacterium sp.]|nr:putative multiple sugar transport system permease protein [Mycobacterium sp.]